MKPLLLSNQQHSHYIFIQICFFITTNCVSNYYSQTLIIWKYFQEENTHFMEKYCTNVCIEFFSRVWLNVFYSSMFPFCKIVNIEVIIQQSFYFRYCNPDFDSILKLLRFFYKKTLKTSIFCKAVKNKNNSTDSSQKCNTIQSHQQKEGKEPTNCHRSTSNKRE